MIVQGLIAQGVAVEQRATTRADLASAGEAFLCSSVREVQAVGAIEGTEYDAPGALTGLAKQALADAGRCKSRGRRRGIPSRGHRLRPAPRCARSPPSPP